jgi:hypothetical protein
MKTGNVTIRSLTESAGTTNASLSQSPGDLEPMVVPAIKRNTTRMRVYVAATVLMQNMQIGIKERKICAKVKSN